MKKTETVTRTLEIALEEPGPFLRVLVPNEGPPAVIVNVKTSGPGAVDCGSRLLLFPNMASVLEAVDALQAASHFILERERAQERQ